MKASLNIVFSEWSLDGKIGHIIKLFRCLAMICKSRSFSKTLSYTIWLSEIMYNIIYQIKFGPKVSELKYQLIDPGTTKLTSSKGNPWLLHLWIFAWLTYWTSHTTVVWVLKIVVITPRVLHIAIIVPTGNISSYCTETVSTRVGMNRFSHRVPLPVANTVVL